MHTARFCRRIALIALAVLCLTWPVAAVADPVTYADIDGVCGGLTPCFTAINEAIFNANDPDADSFGDRARIFVFPGTYAENVDLGQLNGGAGVGDLALVAVDDSGVPTPAAVTIDVPAGRAITRPTNNGHVAIDGFVVHALTDDGIVVNAFGEVEITHVTASSNQGNGIDISTFSNVFVTDTTADGNGFQGISIMVTGITTSVVLERVNAGGNIFTGVFVDADGRAAVSDSTANGNGGAGMNVDGHVATTVLNVAASNNSGAGVRAASVSSLTSVMNVEANGNGAGIVAIGDTGVVVEHVTAGGNAGRGVSVSSMFSSFSIMDARADGNGTTGIFFSSNDGGTITSCSANHNREGIDGMPVPDGPLFVRDTTADDNALFGMRLFSVEDRVIVERCSASRNAAGFGLRMEADGQAAVRDTTVDANGGFGIDIYIPFNDSRPDDVFIERCSASGNILGYGINVFMEPPDGGAILFSDIRADRNASFGIKVDAETGGPAIVQRCSTSDNVKEFGIDIVCGGSVAVLDTVANRNGDYGISGVSGDVNVTIENSTANDNIDGSGFVADADFGRTILRRLTGLRNAGAGLQITNSSLSMNEATVEDSWFQTNGAQGVWMRAMMGRAIRNVICDNEVNGLELSSDIMLLAEANWWGDASGPMHPNNLGGLGNAVVDLANGGMGTVDFDPWIEQVAASVAQDPAVAGQPVEVSFVFADAAQTVFLGEGPGSPNGPPPFTVATDNGVVMTTDASGASIGAFVNNPQGLLTVDVIPAAAGVANVTLIGPCGLDAAVTFAVEPSAEPIDEGSGQEQPMDDFTSDFNTSSAQGFPGCGQCGSIGASLYLTAAIAYIAMLFIRRRT